MRMFTMHDHSYPQTNKSSGGIHMFMAPFDARSLHRPSVATGLNLLVATKSSSQKVHSPEIRGSEFIETNERGTYTGKLAEYQPKIGSRLFSHGIFCSSFYDDCIMKLRHHPQRTPLVSTQTFGLGGDNHLLCLWNIFRMGS